MFEITLDDIRQLDDTQLRELVARLCEAELARIGESPAAVTWGGSQTAPDGGVDVRVELSRDVSIEGFIPRRSTVFQVKKPDSPPSKITAEMRPSKVLRSVIKDLASSEGAYVIVCSTASTADSALQNRKNAMRDALNGLGNAGQLYTDFYDGRRLASWVMCHPGLIIWVREKVGKPLSGWRPYGSWSSCAKGKDSEYLLDEELRLHMGIHGDSSALKVSLAIDKLRDELGKPGKVVRMVGLSGVGKTRLAEALFDRRIGLRPLDTSLAVYTDLSVEPNPRPTDMASRLSTRPSPAGRAVAVLIIDNCDPRTHRTLSEQYGGTTSTISILTIEYDVRDDLPEGTQVVKLDPSSPTLITKLIRRRYPGLSSVDADSVARRSGGNARIAIAIALAATIEPRGMVAGLSDDELFQRLFVQRHEEDKALLIAGQVCSLVYSFNGEARVQDAEHLAPAELPRLAALANQTEAELYRHISDLTRRELVQSRGVWRAVLPDAIANWLAARAIEDIPYEDIKAQLLEGTSERLARSFSRRLSFLGDHKQAKAIVTNWLKPDGLLGDVAAFDDVRREMFENVAPVSSDAALAALERTDGVTTTVWRRRQHLLRSLAYDQCLFERSVRLMILAVTQSTNESEAKEASSIFVSLFALRHSGTKATIEQRLPVIEQLLRSGEAKSRELGMAALERALDIRRVDSSGRCSFAFGALSRDYGYEPQNSDDTAQWCRDLLSLIDRLYFADRGLRPALREQLAKHFTGLWVHGYVHGELDALFRRIAADGFWGSGRDACTRVLRENWEHLSPEHTSQLSALWDSLKPSDTAAEVRAFVVGEGGLELDVDNSDSIDKRVRAKECSAKKARELGESVVRDDALFAEVLPSLLCGGLWLDSFGRGLARAALDPGATWGQIVAGLALVSPELRCVQVLQGFLVELKEQNPERARHLLDSAHEETTLMEFLPLLHTAVGLDEYGITQLKRALIEGKVPVQKFSQLAMGKAAAHLAGGVLKDLLVLISDRADGFDVALDILDMRLYLDCLANMQHEPELLEAGQDLLLRIPSGRQTADRDRRLAKLVNVCVTTPDAYPIALKAAAHLARVVATPETSIFDYLHFLEALSARQPLAVLNGFYSDEALNQGVRDSMFSYLHCVDKNPADAIPSDVLVTWCEGDREHRYPLAASIISFACRPEANGIRRWSVQAEAILQGTSEPRRVLEVLLKRLEVRSWSGSRSAAMEANFPLLDSLELLVAPNLIPLVKNARIKLKQDIARERQHKLDDHQGFE